MSEVIAILGMHRSGTSCLTGLLQEAGVFLGAVATKSVWNPKGNREHPRIMALHEELLGLNGGSWDAPPTSVTWPPQSRLARDAIIQSYENVPLWGFKDPRTLVVLEGWLEVLPDLQLVGIFRHPLLVAESLRRRNGFPLEKGLRLWHIYNEILLAYHGHYGFPILSFDSEAFTDSFLRSARSLGLPGPCETALEFFDPRLRHRTPTVELPLPRDSQELYLALNKVAG